MEVLWVSARVFLYIHICVCRILESKIESIVASMSVDRILVSFSVSLGGTHSNTKKSMYALKMSLTHEQNASYLFLCYIYWNPAFNDKLWNRILFVVRNGFCMLNKRREEDIPTTTEIQSLTMKNTECKISDISFLFSFFGQECASMCIFHSKNMFVSIHCSHFVCF